MSPNRERRVPATPGHRDPHIGDVFTAFVAHYPTRWSRERPRRCFHVETWKSFWLLEDPSHCECKEIRQVRVAFVAEAGGKKILISNLLETNKTERFLGIGSALPTNDEPQFDIHDQNSEHPDSFSAARVAESAGFRCSVRAGFLRRLLANPYCGG